MTEPTTTTQLPVCPFNCCSVPTCNICLNPVTNTFEPDFEAEDTYPPEDYYVGYNEYGDCMGG